MNEVFEAVDRIRKFVDKSKIERDMTSRQLDSINERIVSLEDTGHRLKLAKSFLDNMSRNQREDTRIKLESVVTAALHAVYGTSMHATISLDYYEDSTAAPKMEILVTTTTDNGEEHTAPPDDTHGGGIIDVISLALRVAILENTFPGSGPLILDEPAKHVSADLSPRVAEFLRTISDSLDRQIIMVTHNNDLSSIGNKSFEVSKRDGRSYVRVL